MSGDTMNKVIDLMAALKSCLRPPWVHRTAIPEDDQCAYACGGQSPNTTPVRCARGGRYEFRGWPLCYQHDRIARREHKAEKEREAVRKALWREET